MRRVIHVLGQSGHKDTIFRSDADLKAGETLKKDEVSEREARVVFNDIMKDKRHAAFVAEEDREIVGFDPEAKEILIASQIAGG